MIRYNTEKSIATEVTKALGCGNDKSRTIRSFIIRATRNRFTVGVESTSPRGEAAAASSRSTGFQATDMAKISTRGISPPHQPRLASCLDVKRNHGRGMRISIRRRRFGRWKSFIARAKADVALAIMSRANTPLNGHGVAGPGGGGGGGSCSGSGGGGVGRGGLAVAFVLLCHIADKLRGDALLDERVHTRVERDGHVEDGLALEGVDGKGVGYWLREAPVRMGGKDTYIHICICIKGTIGDGTEGNDEASDNPPVYAQ